MVKISVKTFNLTIQNICFQYRRSRSYTNRVICTLIIIYEVPRFVAVCSTLLPSFVAQLVLIILRTSRKRIVKLAASTKNASYIKRDVVVTIHC